MRSLVITTINKPNKAMKKLAKIALQNEIQFVIVGDLKTPEAIRELDAVYLDVYKQKKYFNKLASLIPYNHYARKNLGYLYCIQNGTEIIQETDDDNVPKDNFLEEIKSKPLLIKGKIKWYNVYKWFTAKNIWPRGFPLEYLKNKNTIKIIKNKKLKPFIYQGLADNNPDVDAIYRMTEILPIYFKNRKPIILDKNVWCPFNSQNTTFLKEAFPLLYLPSYCSFRMTDIWRALISQRCLWEINGGVMFHSATMYQRRNYHNLINDFKDEIFGYLNNEKIRVILENLSLSKDTFKNLYLCYSELIKAKILPKEELKILKVWIKELEKYKNV